MRDLWNIFRGNQPRLEGLHYAFEKAGLVLDDQPIPWCAEAVIVRAEVEMLPTALNVADFQLRVGAAAVKVEHVQWHGPVASLSFRLGAPSRSALVDLVWKNRSLGQLALPVLSQAEFTKKCMLDMPTVSVRLGAQTIACQTYVSSQCQGWIASAVVRSEVSLAPAADIGLTVEVRRQEGGVWARTPVQLSSTQMQAREALISVAVPKPRRTGTWEVLWRLGERELSCHAVRAITRQQFLRSLKVGVARFVIQDRRGDMHIAALPLRLDKARRVGPCFLIVSGEPGMAAFCKLQAHGHGKGEASASLLYEEDVLISDGPTPWAPGTLDVDDALKLNHFELRCGRDTLGTLPLSPAPAASFTSEGGFKLPESVPWSDAADLELKDRLERLLSR